MLEGLEISELKFSEVEVAHVDFRTDAEFYGKLNLTINGNVENIRHKSLGSLCTLIAGPFGSAITTNDYDSNSGIRYVRATDIKSFFLNENSPVFVSKYAYERFPQFHLKENDILLTVVGMNFGIPALIKKDNCPAIFSCKSTLIRDPSINPYYLLTYLSSEIGHRLARRGYRGAAQPGINLSDVGSILIPIFSETFQLTIEELVRKSRSILEQSQTFYRDAETTLEKFLEISKINQSDDPISIKTFENSFLTSGRLDAEYYLPRYEFFEEKIHNYRGGWKNLKDICNLKDDNFNPADTTTYKYIELSDIDNFGSIVGHTELVGRELPSRARRLVSAGDVLISSIEGSLSSCAIVQGGMDKALCSTGFYVINSDEIQPEVLLVLFKSRLMQNLLRKNCSGTILTAINKVEFENIPIPCIDMNLQKEISRLMKESFNFKSESEEYLEAAKQAVKMAVDRSEAAALAYLQGVI